MFLVLIRIYLDNSNGEHYDTTYEVADMMIGVRNMIEAADLRPRRPSAPFRRHAQRQDDA